MKWNSKAETLYCEIVNRVPVSKRKLVETALRRGAEGKASKLGADEVTESEVVVGFFEVTPEPFHSQVKANLKGLGIDYNKYIDNYIANKGSTKNKKSSIKQILQDFQDMSIRLGVSFDRKCVEAALSAFPSQFNHSPVAMRITTKSLEHKDIAIRFLDLLKTTKPDPLTTAFRCGFTNNDGHPIYSLYSEAKKQTGAFGYGVDVDATRGFSKIWMAPSIGMGSTDIISSLEHLPQAAKNTIPHFERFGLNSFGLIGFDFNKKSINLYVMIKATGGPSQGYGPQLTDIGIQPDSFEVLESCRPANVIYYSFSWTSMHVERVCFSMVYKNHEEVPAHFHPRISECLNDPVFMHDQPMCVYSVAWSQKGHYFKFDNDYNGEQANQLLEAGDIGVSPNSI